MFGAFAVKMHPVFERSRRSKKAFRDSSKEELFCQEEATLIITDSFTEERFSLGYRYRMFMFTFKRDRRFK